MFLIKALIAVNLQEQDKERIYGLKVARGLYRKDHEHKEDIRLKAFKFVADKFSNTFARDAGAAEVAAEGKRKQKRKYDRDNFSKRNHTKIKHIHRVVTDYRDDR